MNSKYYLFLNGFILSCLSTTAIHKNEVNVEVKGGHVTVSVSGM